MALVRALIDTGSNVVIRKGHTYPVIERLNYGVSVRADGGSRTLWDGEYEEVATVDSMPPAAAPQALRYNAGKGEHDYLLTYPGGIDAVFDEGFAYYDTLQALAAWYREDQCCSVVGQLRADAEFVGDDLATALAETNARGAEKYEVGNYLKGANYRQYCQSAIRHAQRLQAGETHDSEGNNHLGALVFNILALDMCVAQGIGVDDRIKAPCVQERSGS